METERFWLVWSPEGGSPTYRHAVRSSAVNEAERLARKAPGRQFFVLEATDLRVVNDMQRIALLHPRNDEAPF